MTREDFLRDPHAARYRDVVEKHRDAFTRVLTILSDPYQQEQLEAAQKFQHPALAGVVRAIEADEIVAACLASPASRRFRQAVGVAVRLTMEAKGWSTTGKKGPIHGASYFKTAERYAPPPSLDQDPDLRALAALEAIERIGDDAERHRTAADLLASLAETRHAENRPF